MQTFSDNIVQVDSTHPDSAAIERAVEALRSGAAVVFPTDTVYGIGVATGEGCVPDILFEIKRRERSQTIPWLVRDARDIERIGRDVPDYCIRLAERFFPGALTLVVRCGDVVPAAFQGGDGTIALRAPDHAVPQAIMQLLDAPLATTSANLHGRPAASSATDLDPELVRLVPVALDGGPTPGGVPSTIVACTGPEPHILREGAIPGIEIMECAQA